MARRYRKLIEQDEWDARYQPDDDLPDNVQFEDSDEAVDTDTFYSNLKSESRKPSKRLIKLSEQDLRSIVKESVKRALKEAANPMVANMWKKQYETCMFRIPELLEKLKTYALEGDYSKASDVWEYELSSEIQTLSVAKWQVENNPNGEDSVSLKMKQNTPQL